MTLQRRWLNLQGKLSYKSFISMSPVFILNLSTWNRYWKSCWKSSFDDGFLLMNFFRPRSTERTHLNQIEKKERKQVWTITQCFCVDPKGKMTWIVSTNCKCASIRLIESIHDSHPSWIGHIYASDYIHPELLLPSAQSSWKLHSVAAHADCGSGSSQTDDICVRISLYTSHL